MDSVNSTKRNAEYSGPLIISQEGGSILTREEGGTRFAFHGVTKHKTTGRYEAHLWDRTFRKPGAKSIGKQGGYDSAEKAARCYDIAALKYWGSSAKTNFPRINYENEIIEMQNQSKEDVVGMLRR